MCLQIHSDLFGSRPFLKGSSSLKLGPWEFILLWFHFDMSLRFLPPWCNARGMLWPKRWPVEYSPNSHFGGSKWSWLCSAWWQHLPCGRLQLEYGMCPHWTSAPFCCAFCFPQNVLSPTYVPFKGTTLICKQ